MGHGPGCAQQAYAHPDGQRPQLSYHRGRSHDHSCCCRLRDQGGGRTGRLAGRPGCGLCPGSGFAAGLLICGSTTAACGCRAYLTEGVCGHADAVLAAAKAAGLCGSSATAGRTSAASQQGADSLLSRAALRGRDALRDIADPSPCFEGLAAKSRSITEGGCFSGLRGRSRAAIQDAQAAVPDGTPLKAVQAGRRNRSVPKKVSEPEVLHARPFSLLGRAGAPFT